MDVQRNSLTNGEKNMSSELLFLGLLFLPTFLAIGAWVYRHSSTSLTEDSTPINYWGSYHNNVTNIKYSGIVLPELKHEENESSSHMHTIGVHP
jgi:hypothetical protein